MKRTAKRKSEAEPAHEDGHDQFTPMEDLDQMIRMGHGETPQLLIPANWARGAGTEPVAQSVRGLVAVEKEREEEMSLYRTYVAYRSTADESAWECFRMAFYSEVTMRYLPYRLYLARHKGRDFPMDKMPVQWMWRGRVIWKSKELRNIQ